MVQRVFVYVEEVEVRVPDWVAVVRHIRRLRPVTVDRLVEIEAEPGGVKSWS